LAIVVVAISVLSLSCGEDGPARPVNTAPSASFSVTPSSGTTETDFGVDASGCSDAENAVTELEVRWDWENDGTWETSYSATKTATHRYGTTGTKTIKMEVKDTEGLTDTTTLAVVVSEVNTAPLASFAVNPASGTTETDFEFDASACTDAQDAVSELEVRWDWENDGAWDTQYSTTKTETHRYWTAGTKTIKMGVKDTGGLMDDTTLTVAVDTPPVASFTVNPASGTTETDFEFDASASTDDQDPTSELEVRWDWENDGAWDTQYSTTKTATHRYGTTGTKTIKLEVRDVGGLTGETTRDVGVNGAPPPGMIYVPAGVFTMGDGVGYCGVNEREVTLTRSFYLGQHEVTNQEYMEVVQWAYDNGYVTATTASVQDNLDGSTQELLDLDSENCEIQFDGVGTFSLRESPSSDAQNAYPGGYNPADHPVQEVTWYGAARYCDWLSLMEGLPRAYQHAGDWACNGGDPYGAEGYRLPTDAEWEYAAQWDDERIYPWGDEPPDCSRANFYDSDFCVGWTSPVGSYPDGPASLRLSDMAGNIGEWCNDWHACNLGTSPATDPTGPGSGTARVLRGGNWIYGVTDLRCASRDYSSAPDDSDYYIGFRTSRTAGP
jgi:formylglycine-generating enzyme required for sulfatase activity